MMEHQDANELLKRYRAGTATEAERGLVERHFRDYVNAASDPLPEGELADLNQRIRQHVLPKVQPRRPRILRLLPYAAAVLLVAAVVGYFALGTRKSSVDRLAATEILPGGNRATLTLADGRTINLSSEQEGIVIQDGVTYLDGSQVMENEELSMKNERPGGENGILSSQLPMLNSITTPKGGTYQITLPDGSRVWLNANSTLNYPSRFSGDSREVFLEGEAFFDIRPKMTRGKARTDAATHDYASFHVRTASQVVQVLGTQFNIAAYPDEPETETTLVEGSVAIENLVAKTANRLRPGDQSVVRGPSTTIRQVETGEYAAWREGYFSFDVPVHDVFRQIGRWYDVDVSYAPGADTTLAVYARISRHQKLADVLAYLAEAEPRLRVTQTGRRLTVMQ